MSVFFAVQFCKRISINNFLYSLTQLDFSLKLQASFALVLLSCWVVQRFSHAVCVTGELIPLTTDLLQTGISQSWPLCCLHGHDLCLGHYQLSATAFSLDLFWLISVAFVWVVRCIDIKVTNVLSLFSKGNQIILAFKIDVIMKYVMNETKLIMDCNLFCFVSFTANAVWRYDIAFVNIFKGQVLSFSIFNGNYVRVYLE